VPARWRPAAAGALRHRPSRPALRRARRRSFASRALTSGSGGMNSRGEHPGQGQGKPRPHPALTTLPKQVLAGGPVPGHRSGPLPRRARPGSAVQVFTRHGPPRTSKPFSRAIEIDASGRPPEVAEASGVNSWGTRSPPLSELGPLFSGRLPGKPAPVSTAFPRQTTADRQAHRAGHGHRQPASSAKARWPTS